MGKPRRTFDKRLILGGASWAEVLTGAPAWGVAGQPTITRQPLIGKSHDQASIHAHGYLLTIARVWDTATVDTIRDHRGDNDIHAAIIGAEAAAILPVRIPSADRDFRAVDAATAALSLPSSGSIRRTTTAADISAFDLEGATLTTSQALGSPDKSRDSYLIVTSSVSLTHVKFTITTGSASEFELPITGAGIVPIAWPSAWPASLAGLKLLRKSAAQKVAGWVLTLDKQAAPNG